MSNASTSLQEGNMEKSKALIYARCSISYVLELMGGYLYDSGRGDESLSSLQFGCYIRFGSIPTCTFHQKPESADSQQFLKFA